MGPQPGHRSRFRGRARGALSGLHGELGDQEFSAAYAAGRVLDAKAATTLATRKCGQQRTGASGWDSAERPLLGTEQPCTASASMLGQRVRLPLEASSDRPSSDAGAPAFSSSQVCFRRMTHVVAEIKEPCTPLPLGCSSNPSAGASLDTWSSWSPQKRRGHMKHQWA